MSRTKPKQNYSNQPERDRCQSPPVALEPLLEHLNKNEFSRVWEPAKGEGNFFGELTMLGFDVQATDLQTGHDFLTYAPPLDSYDVIVTNPPFSIKYKFLKRCYDLKKPFALLMPLEAQGAQTAIKMFEKFGYEFINVYPRINYKMPNAGWGGGGAQFPSSWYTFGLSIGEKLSYYELPRECLRTHSKKKICWGARTDPKLLNDIRMKTKNGKKYERIITNYHKGGEGKSYQVKLFDM